MSQEIFPTPTVPLTGAFQRALSGSSHISADVDEEERFLLAHYLKFESVPEGLMVVATPPLGSAADKELPCSSSREDNRRSASTGEDNLKNQHAKRAPTLYRLTRRRIKKRRMDMGQAWPVIGEASAA
jgi:hypothetical protein